MVRRNGIFGTYGFKGRDESCVAKGESSYKMPNTHQCIETRNFLGLAGNYRVLGRVYQTLSSPTNVLKESTKLARR